jgi:hypothetical protein
MQMTAVHGFAPNDVQNVDLTILERLTESPGLGRATVFELAGARTLAPSVACINNDVAQD